VLGHINNNNIISRNPAVVENADCTALSGIAVVTMPTGTIEDVEILNLEIWEWEFESSGSV